MTREYIPNGSAANKADIEDYNSKVKQDLNKNQAPIDGSDNKSMKKQPSESIRKSTTFSWNHVGSWNEEQMTNKLATLSLLRAIESYVLDHFYGDWYWNCSLMVGTCFFAWLFGRIGGGILSLGFVLLFTNSVYRIEFRRFNRDVRDDMSRVAACNRLEDELETMEWLNSFLSKFWIIYMPELSSQVMFQANEVLKDQAPGFGIEALSLDEFTLGSKAPRINSVKSYTRKGHDHIEMDWAFSFAPNDTDDMTKNEIKHKINPKVALGVTVGKAFISKSLPVLVEDMSFTGRMNIKLKLSQNFPHVKLVSLQFLEAPTIDYALKPVGGDTFGIDIMSFIPGLSSFVNGLIHSNLRPMLYAPNSLDIDVEEILAQQSNDSNGVAVVTINRLINLKTGAKTEANSINPYVRLKVSGNPDIDERTNVKKLVNDPVYFESKYLLLHTLLGNHLEFSAYHLVEDKQDDLLIGNYEFDLGDLLQNETQLGLVKNLKESGKTVGKIEFDVRYYPALKPIVLEDGSKESNTESEVGIMKLTLHEADALDLSDSVIGLLNPYAEIYVNDELIKSCRRLHQTNSPSWNQSFESFITQQSKTKIQILVKDSIDNNVVAKLNANLQDLIFETSRGQEWFKCPPVRPDGPESRIRITGKWKGVAIGEDITKTSNSPAIGGVRIHIRSASGLKNLESVGKIDPYVRVLSHGKVVGRTATIANTTEPFFNSVFLLPSSNDHSHFLLDFMDEESEGLDRGLGSAAISVHEFLKVDTNGYYVEHDGSEEILHQDILLNGKPHGTLSYSVSFIPTIPIYSISQLQNKEAYLEELRKQEIEDAKRREKDEKLIKEYPNEYEWVDIGEAEVPTPERIEMPLEKVIKHRVGVIAVHVLSGHFRKSDIHVHTLFDDHAYPSGVSPKSEGRDLKITSDAECFIRDLPNSQMILRLSHKVDVHDEKFIIAEKKFETLHILKKANNKPITLSIDEENSVEVQLEFIPSNVTLAPFDTILDVGKLKLDILGAENLMSADSNGKSDPYLVVKLDGIQIYKTDKKRKTLNPLWNEAFEFPLLSRSKQIILLECFDWDLTKENELLGKVNLDLSTLDPLNSTQFMVDLDTQGCINMRATFFPEYIRPKLKSSSGLPIDLGSVTGAPLKLAGGAAGLAGNALGSGIGLVSDGATKGTSKLKGLGRNKKNKEPSPSKDESFNDKAQNSHFDDEESTNGSNQLISDQESVLGSQKSSSTTHSKQSPKKSMDTVQKSQYASDVQSLRSGAQPVGAIPNLNPDFLPPPQRPNTHKRTPSNATSFANSINGPDAIPGRISIISASGFSSSSLEVKAILQTSTKERELCKTRVAKLNKELGYKWNESVPFKAATTAQLVFSVREHHTFGKNTEVGRAVLPLNTVIDKHENMSLSIENGELTINIRYISIAPLPQGDETY